MSKSIISEAEIAAQFFPFRQWLKANKISTATGYRLVKEKKLRIAKIRSRSYITKDEEKRFVASIQSGGSHE